jgi:hypothetical protein
MDALPPNAGLYLPALVEQARAVLPQVPTVLFAGQVEQESCISLKHSRCWNPKVELKTAREYGFGLGQLTVAYNADGSERFNAWREVRQLDSRLANWTWENRYDAGMQLRAIVVKDRQALRLGTAGVTDPKEARAMMFAAYNGGIGGLLSDRKLCQATPKCDWTRWWANVELHSKKSRTPWHGYGKSAFDINREYPRLIEQRAPKYAPAVQNLTERQAVADNISHH